ncbi:MAG: IS66 family transposase [Alkalilacustris sp.]
MAQAHAPEHVVPGGLPTERLIAWIIVSKFGDHLPFYRQAGIFERQGLQLDSGTLGNWVGRACFHLMPVIEHMKTHLRAADRIFVALEARLRRDETRAPVLDPGRKATKSGYFWAVVADDRSHGGAGPPIVLFHYAPGRGKAHPLKLLGGYRDRLPRNATPTSPMTRRPRSRAIPVRGSWSIAGPMSAAASSSASRTRDDAQTIAGIVAETYLRGRGITCALPPTLRFAPSCWHASAQRFPALVALVEGGDGFAVHRTYLRRDGGGKAEVDPPKAMLGAVAGGAVKLAQGPGRLAVAEGIETALSLACGLLNGPATVWAALSTSGMTGLRLPDIPGRLTVAPDGDKAGRGAALTLADRAARDGWAVSILTPPPGGDFNDILRGEVTA